MGGLVAATGSGFLWSWLYCLWFSRSDMVTGSLITVDDATWLASMLVAAVTQVLLLLNRQRVAVVFAHPVFVMATGLLMGALSFVFCLGGVALDGSARWVICIVNASMSGMLWSAWGFSYDVIGMDAFRRAVPLAALVVLPSMALCQVLSGWELAVFIALLPVISSLLLVAVRQFAWAPRPVRVLSEEKAAKAQTIARRLGVIVLLVGADLYFGLIVLIEADAAPAQTGTVGVMVGAVLVALLAVALLARHLNGVTHFLKWLLWLSVVALALAACDAALACLLLNVAVFGVDFLAILAFSLIASRGYMATSTAFIMGESLVEIGFSAGYLIGALVIGVAGVPSTSYFMAGAIGVMVLLLMQLLSQQANIELLTLSNGATAQEGAKSEKVAAAYGLSKREAEVLAYLIQGRTVAYVSDALFISTNTVDTHVRHIYGKMGVHSRQELLDLVFTEDE